MKRQFFALLLAILVSGRLSADTIVWTNKTSGSYSTAANWNPNQVPKAGDLAELRATTAYTITLNGPATNHSLHVYDGQPTIDLAGFDYRLTNSVSASAKTVGIWVEKGFLKITNSAPTPAIFGSNDTIYATLYQPWLVPVGKVEFTGPTTVVRLRRILLNAASPANLLKHELRITGGAKVTTTTVPAQTLSPGGDILISGPETVLSVSGMFLNSGGFTVVSNQALLTAGTGSIEVGRPGKGYLTITGSGTTCSAGTFILTTADTATYGSIIVTNGATLTASSAIYGPNLSERQCDMTVSGAGTTATTLDLRVSGGYNLTTTFVNNPFRLTLSAAAIMRVTRHTRIWTNGLVRLDNAKLYNSTQGVVNYGRLEGRGRLERHDASGTVLWDNYGTIKPGLTNWAFGALVFTNCNLTLRPSSALVFDIGAAAPESYSRIAVHGTATLGGTCQVRLAPGYAPKHGDTFQLIAANAFSGGFAARDLPNIAPASWDIDELDSAGKLVVYGPPRETILLVR